MSKPPKFGPMETSTTVPIIATASTVYTDKQFYADCRKARKRLDAMERKALKDDKEGKTRKFP